MTQRTLGERIRQIRKGAGLTQRELAEACGVTAAAVTMWERGQTRPRPERLAQIARACGAATASTAARVLFEDFTAIDGLPQG